MKRLFSTLLLGLAASAALLATHAIQTRTRTVPVQALADQATFTPVNSEVKGQVGDRPMIAEVNPPGDIPDTQAFITYTSPNGGYHVEVPEGWARREEGSNVSFVSNLDGVAVTLSDAPSSLTADFVKTHQAAQMERSGQAQQIVAVNDVQLPSGAAVLIQYTSSSDPDSVTGRSILLENEAYLLVHNGKLATLRLWAPQGADNVDQWQRMSQSFGWS